MQTRKCASSLYPVWWILLGLLLNLMAPAALAAEPSLFNQLRQIDQQQPLVSVPDRLLALRKAYVAGVPDALTDTDCSNVSADQLDDLFQATALLGFYERDAGLLARLRCLHAALNAHGRLQQDHHRQLRGALLAARRFEEANALRARMDTPGPVLPTIRGDTMMARPLLRLAEPGVVERAALATDGVHVIAMVHPYCGFSRRALEEIVDNPDYAWLQPHLQLVVQNGQNWPEQDMRDWNRAHPALPMQAAVSDPSWIGFDLSSTPVFHLVRDGKVIGTASGWSGGGAELTGLRQALEAELR